MCWHRTAFVLGDHLVDFFPFHNLNTGAGMIHPMMGPPVTWCPLTAAIGCYSHHWACTSTALLSYKVYFKYRLNTLWHSTAPWNQERSFVYYLQVRFINLHFLSSLVNTCMIRCLFVSCEVLLGMICLFKSWLTSETVAVHASHFVYSLCCCTVHLCLPFYLQYMLCLWSFIFTLCLCNK